jgi:hypothetical protein
MRQTNKDFEEEEKNKTRDEAAARKEQERGPSRTVN